MSETAEQKIAKAIAAGRKKAGAGTKVDKVKVDKVEVDIDEEITRMKAKGFNPIEIVDVLMQKFTTDSSRREMLDYVHSIFYK
mgnify:CR=1 FL=1